MNTTFSRFFNNQFPHAKYVFQKSLGARSFHCSFNAFGTIKPFLLADIGEGITECEIVQWFIEPGAKVAEFDRICEVQSDKASVEISSRYAGSIVKLHYGKHDIAKVGAPLVDIETDDEEGHVHAVPDATASTTVDPVSSSNYQAEWETPAVRRLLSAYDLNVSDIIGSGKNGRVLKGDVLNHIKIGSLQKVERKKADDERIVHSPVSFNSASDENSLDKTVDLTAIQKAMFKSMTKSLSIPQLGYKDEIDLNLTSEYREVLNKYIASKPDLYPFKKMSYLPIFIKCLSLSLSFFPIMNAQISESTAIGGAPQLVNREAHNIGIAMDTPQGLIVPNIKNVQQKTIFEVAGEIHRLTSLAKEGAIPLSDLNGGTISLSNIGSIGGTYANPIVTSNQLAIVALGSARKLPRFDQQSNTMVAKQILPISWSADHRIIDGATIAQFGNTWKSFIENPALLASKLR